MLVAFAVVRSGGHLDSVLPNVVAVHCGVLLAVPLGLMVHVIDPLPIAVPHPPVVVAAAVALFLVKVDCQLIQV
jgi:hypothetical protein